MLNFDGRVAIVTGAGRGLGRSHALALAERGARVVVNDLGGAVDGTGASSDAAAEVVSQIEEAGGEAIANGANVTSFDQVQSMVDEAHEKWGSVDVLVNNAGILRDKSFNNMELSDFQTVVDVHLMGSVNATKAVWPIMREQNYGRIVMTTSSSGLYGNFGQANYGAAKTSVVGLMNTLHLEGAKYNIRVNCLSPAAATRMLEGLIPYAMAGLLNTDAVAAGLVYLVSEDGPSRTILSAGAGTFAVARIYETAGVSLLPDEVTPEGVAAHWDEIAATDGQAELQMGSQQTEKFVIKAADKLGLSLG
ncbi:MAG: SDR family NAD(P)-dependent oxidoreductase [Acidimicrobiia bacterium]|nr:SDR family NAD(P)-dependent oxidoreductase [Acidimicrobiia bacterium]